MDITEDKKELEIEMKIEERKREERKKAKEDKKKRAEFCALDIVENWEKIIIDKLLYDETIPLPRKNNWGSLEILIITTNPKFLELFHSKKSFQVINLFRDSISRIFPIWQHEISEITCELNPLAFTSLRKNAEYFSISEGKTKEISLRKSVERFDVEKELARIAEEEEKEIQNRIFWDRQRKDEEDLKKWKILRIRLLNNLHKFNLKPSSIIILMKLYPKNLKSKSIIYSGMCCELHKFSDAPCRDLIESFNELIEKNFFKKEDNFYKFTPEIAYNSLIKN
jgi:hypothetical protein